MIDLQLLSRKKVCGEEIHGREMENWRRDKELEER